MTPITFMNRAEYKVAVKQWKQEYALLSDSIRTAKIEFRNGQREMGKVPFYTSAVADYMKAHRALSAAITRLGTLKQDARNAISDRHASKVESARQYDLERALT